MESLITIHKISLYFPYCDTKFEETFLEIIMKWVFETLWQNE